MFSYCFSIMNNSFLLCLVSLQICFLCVRCQQTEQNVTKCGVPNALGCPSPVSPQPRRRPVNCSVQSGPCMTTQCVGGGPDHKLGSPIQMIEGATSPPQVCANTPTNDRLLINGTIRLVDAAHPCGRPVRAMLDIWQANAEGIYSDPSPSSSDFACRARLITGDTGFFIYSSVMPGRYAGPSGYRPVHVHMKITPLDSNNESMGSTLTTQQYFANDMYADPAFHSNDPTLVVHLQHSYDIKTYDGTMDILLPAR